MRKLVILGLQEIKDGRPILRDVKAPARLVDHGGEGYPSLLPSSEWTTLIAAFCERDLRNRRKLLKFSLHKSM